MSTKKSKNQRKIHLVWFAVLLLLATLACQLTSPRPASWAGTPTAEARSTEIALTQSALLGVADFVFTPTNTSTSQEATTTPMPSPTPQEEGGGPYLVYAAPQGADIFVYDLHNGATAQISLPEPIIAEDLITGLAPDGKSLFIRAGSVLNTEELALYQVKLNCAVTCLEYDVSRVSTLLSITLQRQIVNQENPRAYEALTAVTRPDGLAWSPDGRFLAFPAALNNETSDLYILDTLNNRVNRANRYLTQTASPLWSPDSAWLISQELEYLPISETWRAVNVVGLLMPSFINLDEVYTPPPGSREEVFLGWRNIETFISYSITEDGPGLLRQVTSDRLQDSLIFEGPFNRVIFEPLSGVLAFIINPEFAIAQGLTGGLYRLLPDRTIPILQQGGYWDTLTWDPGGMFVASGVRGVHLFTPEGESLSLPGQGNASVSPNGNWIIAWGDGLNSASGARLYQSTSDRPLQTLLESPVETLIWQPDSQGFFIQSEGSLYQFTFPGLKPIQIAVGLPIDTALVWLWVD